MINIYWSVSPSMACLVICSFHTHMEGVLGIPRTLSRLLGEAGVAVLGSRLGSRLLQPWVLQTGPGDLGPPAEVRSDWVLDLLAGGWRRLHLGRLIVSSSSP